MLFLNGMLVLYFRHDVGSDIMLVLITAGAWGGGAGGVPGAGRRSSELFRNISRRAAVQGRAAGARGQFWF